MASDMESQPSCKSRDATTGEAEVPSLLLEGLHVVDEVEPDLDTHFTGYTQLRSHINLLKDAMNRVKIAISYLQEENDQLKKENLNLKEDINALKIQLNEALQCTNLNKIIVTRVPEIPGLNSLEIIERICSVIGFEISTDMFDMCYRSKRWNRLSPGPIILNFTRNSYKLQFLAAVKRNRHLLNSSILQQSSRDRESSPIFISEYRSPYLIYLFNKVKALERDGIVRHVWFHNGHLFARKTTNSRVVNIQRDSDFTSLDASKHKPVS